jgi:hypothetical protein
MLGWCQWSFRVIGRRLLNKKRHMAQVYHSTNLEGLCAIAGDGALRPQLIPQADSELLAALGYLLNPAECQVPRLGLRE